MRSVEIVAAVVFSAMGVRSLVHWARRPFVGGDATDGALFALFVLGRVGTWWSMAGLFVISLTLRDPDPRGGGAFLEGRAFTDVFQARFWWYPAVVLVFVVMQFLAGFFLGRRQPAPRPPAPPV